MKQKEPPEEIESQPTLEDLRAELGLYDDEPCDNDAGWDLGKEETL
jgi:hypothetical protein